MWKKGRSEDGSLIVEASVVFPTMFLVIFFLIFAGNAYLQKCRVEAIVQDVVQKSAAKCGDPLLETIETGTIPAYHEVDLKPYRYMLGSVGSMAKADEDALQSRLESVSTGLFNNMKPEIADCQMDGEGGFFAPHVYADVTYKILVPVRLLGAEDFMHMEFSTHIEVPVSDVPEFIRNIDMVEDIVQKLSGEDFNGMIHNVADKAKSLFGKKK